MQGYFIHKEMLARCDHLMRRDCLCDEEKQELLAVASACEAYEGVMFPMDPPTPREALLFRKEQMQIIQDESSE